LLLALAALVILGVAVGVGGWLLGNGNTVAVPSIDGMSQSQAMTALQNAGFEPKVHKKYSDGIPAGNVMGTDPSAGSRKAKGSTVLVLVSGGRPRVPKFNPGADKDTVEQQIRDMGLQPVDGDQVYSDSPSGSVYALDPQPGTVVPLGSPVKVDISKGQAPGQMPDLQGMTVAQATDELNKVGAKVGTVTDQSGAAVTDGAVVSSDPAAGAGVGPGSTVNLVVTSQVRIPWSIIGRTVAGATRVLESLGLHVVLSPDMDDDHARVVGIEPGMGTMVDIGSTVTLTPFGGF
jgi:serine/threonine-protein kinase